VSPAGAGGMVCDDPSQQGSSIFVVSMQVDGTRGSVCGEELGEEEAGGVRVPTKMGHGVVEPACFPSSSSSSSSSCEVHARCMANMFAFLRQA
jgi:hypothetical protein